jgi:hypothetical protein
LWQSVIIPVPTAFEYYARLGRPVYLYNKTLNIREMDTHAGDNFAKFAAAQMMLPGRVLPDDCAHCVP